MMPDSEYRHVLAAYPSDCQPREVEPLNAPAGFSGALVWRLETPRGPLCLRRWPPESPSPDRLQFIQAVLWHVDQEGFHLAAVPVETRSHTGYVRQGGFLWEITPWMPGVADYRLAPSRDKLQAALAALAQFHRSAATFPLPDADRVVAPGVVERQRRLRELASDGVRQMTAAIGPGDWPELAARARKIAELFPYAAAKVTPLLETAAQLRVDLQPCIRDIWHDHVLFQGTRVSGLIDFGSMRPENVSADIARLLGSLAEDDQSLWHVGLEAYQRVRPLSAPEMTLVTVFDRSTVAMSGLQWLDWIYLRGRRFANRSAVLARLDDILLRLGKLAIADNS
jgi:homoserine kinase type II